MTWINDTDNSIIGVVLIITHCFQPMYALTAHKCQGMTIQYNIYEYRKMKHYMLYVCLTRTSKHKYVHFCDTDCRKPHTGCIYIYSYT